MSRPYGRRTCYVCGCETSAAGAAYASHMKKHVREGRAKPVMRRYARGRGVLVEYVEYEKA